MVTFRNTIKLSILVLLAHCCAHGQALEPRFYSNAPTGLNFLLGGYSLSSGGVALDPSIPLEDASITTHSVFLAYARSLGLWGRSAKFDIIVPYSFLEGTALYEGAPISRNIEGFADPSIRFSYNLLGAPALSLAEFKDYRQNMVLGTSLKVTAPFGQYDSSRAVNIGTHRWSFSPELGVSKRLGRMLLEGACATTLFTDNNDFVGQKREQDPLYNVQAHLVYLFRNKVWIALDATHYMGGETAVDGVKKDDRLSNSRFGATLALPITKRHSLKFYASTGLETRTGSDFETFGAAWQYRWGGGL